MTATADNGNSASDHWAEITRLSQRVATVEASQELLIRTVESGFADMKAAMQAQETRLRPEKRDMVAVLGLLVVAMGGLGAYQQKSLDPVVQMIEHEREIRIYDERRSMERALSDAREKGLQEAEHSAINRRLHEIEMSLGLAPGGRK